jgi:hypothetical protein
MGAVWRRQLLTANSVERIFSRILSVDVGASVGSCPRSPRHGFRLEPWRSKLAGFPNDGAASAAKFKINWRFSG